MIYYRPLYSKEQPTKTSIDTTEMVERERAHPLITYVNWSYHASKHLSEETIIDILTEFNRDLRFVYLRMFNEIPRDIILSFMNQHNIDVNNLLIIYNIMFNEGHDLKDYNEES